MNNEMVVYFPTNNIGKYERYKKSFELANIQYNRYLINDEGKEEIVDIKEDGRTTKENAEKKAKGYYDAYIKNIHGKPFVIITTDEALYIDGLNDEEQPGQFVRRFGGMDGKRATDEEVVKKYTEIINKLGGNARAKWHYSMVMYNGKEYSYLEWDENVNFSCYPHTPIPKGYVLNSITIIKKDEKGNDVMLSDLSDEDRFEYLRKYTDNVVKFVTGRNKTPDKENER